LQMLLLFWFANIAVTLVCKCCCCFGMQIKLMFWFANIAWFAKLTVLLLYSILSHPKHTIKMAESSNPQSRKLRLT
jgi:hypothetical protein